MRLPMAFFGAIGASLIGGMAMAGGLPVAPSRIGFVDMGGKSVSVTALGGKPVILLFWRSDCGPCLVELQGLAALRRAAAPAKVVTVALQDRSSAATASKRWRIPTPSAWIATGDARTTLVTYGGAPRLPLSVALDPHGAICARHVGLLGTDLATRWSRQCSS